jgi:hypothetical protein
MALSVVPDAGGSLEVWRVTACSLNERIIDSSRFSILEVGLSVNNPSHKENITCYKCLHTTSYLREGSGFELREKQNNELVLRLKTS